MTGAVLFEVAQRGDVWRFIVDDYQGRTYGNWRKWWQDGDVLKPTKQGVMIPLERLSELHAAIGAYLASDALHGPENPA